MKAVLLCIAALLFAAPAHAQALRGNEYVAGAALNIALRAPYIARSWRRPVPRFLLSQAVSISYERFVDCHAWSEPNHRPWNDIGGRLVGYAFTELFLRITR